MHVSGVLRFNECINDMSFFNRFKWTSKGPHSLGRKNSNNISARYRGVHPSFIGQFDLLTCGNSDPGTLKSRCSDNTTLIAGITR